jgi:asparagine synthase (glutamine-hydrolysing)
VHVGEGADELFAGYPTSVLSHAIQTQQWARFRSLPPAARTILAQAGALALRGRPGWETHREALLRGAQPDGHLWWGGAVAFYEQGLRRLTTPEFQRQTGAEAPREIVAGISADRIRGGSSDPLDELIYQDLRLRLPELLLMRVDKLTMANAVEARVPFLDHELVELAMSVPASEKIRGGVGKHVLKRAVADLLPDDLLWRPKQGFGAPVSEWFRGPLADQLRRQIDGSAIHELGFFDRNEIDRLIGEHRTGRAERGFQLWNLLNLSFWFDYWIAGRDVRERALT